MEKELLLFYKLWNSSLQQQDIAIGLNDLAYTTQHDVKIASSQLYKLIYVCISIIIILIPLFWLPCLLIWCLFRIGAPRLSKSELIQLKEINKGIYLFNTRDYTEASKIFENIAHLIIKRDSSFNSWRYYCYFYTKQYSKAITVLETSDVKSANIKKLSCYIETKEFQKIIDTIKKSYYPKNINHNPIILAILCSAMIKLQYPDIAKKTLNDNYKHFSETNTYNLLPYWYTLGKCNEALGIYDEALAAYRTISVHCPDFLDVKELLIKLS